MTQKGGVGGGKGLVGEEQRVDECRGRKRYKRNEGGGIEGGKRGDGGRMVRERGREGNGSGEERG